MLENEVPAVLYVPCTGLDLSVSFKCHSIHWKGYLLLILASLRWSCQFVSEFKTSHSHNHLVLFHTYCLHRLENQERRRNTNI